MKILYVKGIEGSDFGALYFERVHNKKMMLDLWKHIKLQEDKYFYSFDYNSNPPNSNFVELISVYLEALEFKDVDPKFMEFIKVNIQDYDESKYNNFYIVE